MHKTIIDKLPKLTPCLHPWVKAFLSDKNLHKQISQNYGSPLNLHNVEPFIENYQAYVETIESLGLSHQIFYARKANKCKAFVKAAKHHSFGIDTASFEELNQCLSMGYEPEKLVLTAAIKTKEMLTLAIKNEVLIVVDNYDEINAVKGLAAQLNIDAKVAVRLSGFYIGKRKLYSRFGFDIHKAEEVIKEHICIAEHLKYEGLHFHLNGYSIDERVAAFDQLFEVIDKLSKLNIKTNFIDMGGGLLMNYLESEKEWTNFQKELKLALEGVRPPITFENNGLGYKWRNDEIQGKLKTYPYFNTTPKEQMLRQILETSTPKGTIAQGLSDRNIQLRLEPGRSLLDQAGITLAKVVFRKTDSKGDLLIGLEMNKTQLFSSSADFLLDPTLISIEEHVPANEDETVNAYLVGAYCLETDILLKRKITFPHIPQVGDFICFPNTAGYMMHFYESQSHLFELAENLVVSKDATDPGTFKISLDEA